MTLPSTEFIGLEAFFPSNAPSISLDNRQAPSNRTNSI